MARYIDADRLMSKIHELYVQSNIELWQVLKCVGNSPTADVVPKSEYDAVVSAVDNSTKEFLKLHDKYQEAKREIENLKVLLEMKDVSYAGLKELYDTDTTALIEAREKTEVYVAKEIFAEIEEHIKADRTPSFSRGYYGIINFIAELKKKYQEGE